MEKALLNWLEQEVAEAWEAMQNNKTEASRTKWVALHSVQEKIKEILYKEAME